MIRNTTRKTTLSLAASLLLLSSAAAPAFARDDHQQQQSRPSTAQTAERGGLTGNLPGSDQQATAPTVAPALPIEEAPATQQQAPVTQQAPALPALESELPALPPRAQLPALGELPSNQLPALGEEPSSQLPAFGELPASELPSLGEEVALPPAQAFPSQVAQSEAQPEKKPGFFKRMWQKVTTFYSNVKTKIGERIATFRANRAERAAERAQAEANAQQEYSQQDYTPVFDADIHAAE